MSVYNFDDREHDAHPTQPEYNNRSNGTAGYHQMESDFLNRNMANVSNQVDNSVQLTRPTSKTALLVRQRRAMLEQLSCFICKGYLIDATTLDECMDSFCRSCIVLHLGTHNSCPKCHVVIGHHNPLSAIRPDKVLQDIVYKLIPGLYDDEMKRRRDFFREFYGASQSSSDEDADSDSSSGTLTIQGTKVSGECYGVIVHPKPFYKPTDSIDLSIEPQTRGDSTTIYYDNHRQSIVTCFTGSLQQRDLNNDSSSVFSSVDSQLFKTYLRCPAKFTILQLKKFIAAKFNICRDDNIHLLYLNELLLDDYSLIDVAYIYDWRGIEHMQLFYKIERDLVKVNTGDPKRDDHLPAGKVTRQSVGISTQTVKRVCIDPRPKFYDEEKFEVIAKTEGRSMRPRASETTNGTKTNPVGPGNRTPVSTQVVETRSLRGKVTSAIKSITQEAQRESKTNIGACTLSQGVQLSPSGAQHQPRNVAPMSRDNTVRQPLPYGPNRVAPYSANATQSSIVTLASFIEARAKNSTIRTVSSTSTSVQSLVNDPQVSTITNSSSPLRQHAAPKITSTPELAFSYVTERGITIVRRLNNEAAMQSTSSSATTTTTSGTPQLHAMTSTMRSAGQTSTSNLNLISNQPAPQSPPGHGVNEEVVSSRHNLKAKPVYKLFPDPTKLKSPNLKKLGFTIRH